MERLFLATSALALLASSAAADFKLDVAVDPFDNAVYKAVAGASANGEITFNLMATGDIGATLKFLEVPLICGNVESETQIDWVAYNGSTPGEKVSESWGVTRAGEYAVRVGNTVAELEKTFGANEGIRFRIMDQCNHISTITIPSTGFKEAMIELRK